MKGQLNSKEAKVCPQWVLWTALEGWGREGGI